MQITPRIRGSWLRARDQLALNSGSLRRDSTPAAHMGRDRRLRAAVLQLRAWLAQGRAVWLIVGASMLLCAPAIAAGYILDDYFHTVVFSDDLRSDGSERAAWDAFAFAKSPELTLRMINQGIFPWWSDLQGRMAFFRPLTSLSLWADHQLWPHAPALMHIHSLAWYAVLLLVVAKVYRRFAATSFSVGFSGLALLIYACDDARAMTVGWLANRGTLVGLAFGFGALLAHDGWRTHGGNRYLIQSLLLLSVGLLCAESTVQAVAYVLAYAWYLDTGTKKQRLRSVLPYVALISVWRTCHSVLGYGAVGSTQYIDPIRYPLRFLCTTAERLPVLLAAQFVGLSADLGAMLQFAAPQLVGLIMPISIAALAACVWLVYPFWLARREVRFWALGSVLSTLPVCAATPSDRLLIATGLGGAALVAIVSWAVLDRARELSSSRLRSYGLVVVAGINIVVAPLLLPVQAYALMFFDDFVSRAERSIPDGSEVAGKTVVLLNLPGDEYGIYMGHRRLVRGGAMPKRLRWIASSNTDIVVTRLDATAIRVRPSQGFLPPGSAWTLRTPDYESHVGETLQLDAVTYTVTDVTPDGRPAEVVVRFRHALDGEEFIWMQWGGDGEFVTFVPPAVGAAPMLVPAKVSGVLFSVPAVGTHASR